MRMIKAISPKWGTIKIWLAPFFFSLFSTLVIYSHNIDQLAPSRMLVPLIYSVFLFILSACVSFVLFRTAEKASIFTSLWVLLFFSYGYIYLYLGDKTFVKLLPISLNKLLLTIFFVGLMAVGWWLTKTHKSLQKIVSFFTVIGTSLIVINLMTIIPFELRRTISAIQLRTYISNNLEQIPANKESSLKPDIYYIIFDRYARQDVFQKYFNFNNQEHLSFLESKGFLIGESSYANYPNTFLSLSSSLNVTYLDFLTETLGKNQNDRNTVYEQLIETNQVARFLQKQGYKYVISGSFWDPTKVTGIADENNNLFSDFDEFHLYIYERTLLNTLKGILEKKQLYAGVERLNKISLNLNYRLSKIKNQKTEPQPVFVFAHFLMPHEPGVFSEECEPLTFKQMRSQSAEEGYLKETKCANLVMKSLIEKIQSESNRPVVIIFQSDEGPYLPEKYFNQNGQLAPSEFDSCFIHGAILNAIYMPNKEDSLHPVDYAQIGLKPNSSPVNTFRAIFNYYFGTSLPLLENKTYLFVDEQHPYQFNDITSHFPTN